MRGVEWERGGGWVLKGWGEGGGGKKKGWSVWPTCVVVKNPFPVD